MSNTLLLTSMLLSLLDRSAQIGSVLATAQKEGRDITAEELNAIFAGDLAAKAKLQAWIETK